jgi:coenzyme PQQ precursor peptide PqqA
MVTGGRKAANVTWSGESPGRKCAPKENTMSWTAPVVVEICAGMEVTAYLTAEM